MIKTPVCCLTVYKARSQHERNPSSLNVLFLGQAGRQLVTLLVRMVPFGATHSLRHMVSRHTLATRAREREIGV